MLFQQKVVRCSNGATHILLLKQHTTFLSVISTLRQNHHVNVGTTYNLRKHHFNVETTYNLCKRHFKVETTHNLLKRHFNVEATHNFLLKQHTTFLSVISTLKKKYHVNIETTYNLLKCYFNVEITYNLFKRFQRWNDA
jgi:hypothetical protein